MGVAFKYLAWINILNLNVYLSQLFSENQLRLTNRNVNILRIDSNKIITSSMKFCLKNTCFACRKDEASIQVNFFLKETQLINNSLFVILIREISVSLIPFPDSLSFTDLVSLLPVLQLFPSFLIHTICYGLKVYVLPKMQMLKSNPQCEGIWRWGLWEAITS